VAATETVGEKYNGAQNKFCATKTAQLNCKDRYKCNSADAAEEGNDYLAGGETPFGRMAFPGNAKLSNGIPGALVLTTMYFKGLQERTICE
jgi:hypothetical protein